MFLHAGGRVQNFALDQQLLLQGAQDHRGACRAAGDEHLADRPVMLVLEEVNGGAKLPAQRQYQRIEMGLNFRGHPDFDALGLGVTDVEDFGQAARQFVTPDRNHPAEDQIALHQDADGRGLETDIHKGDRFLGKDLGHHALETIDRADERRGNRVGDQPGAFGPRHKIVNELGPGGGHQDLLLLQARGGLFSLLSPFRRLRRLGAQVAVEDVAGQILLEVGLGVELKQQAHVGDGHAGQVGMADRRIGVAHGERDMLCLGLKALLDGLKMLAEQIPGHRLLVDWRVEQDKTAKGQALAAALDPNGLGCSTAEIHGHDLVAFPGKSTV